MKLEEIVQIKEFNDDNILLAEEMLNYIAQTNDPQFNIDKLGEELAECLEVIMKMKAKKGDDYKPKMERLWEEIYDVILRTKIFMEGATDTDFEDFAERRHIEKMNKFLGYLKENKYQNTI